MELLGPDDVRRIASLVLDASTADETEVQVASEADRFARFAEDGPTQSADRARVEVSVRVRRRTGEGWREARATTGATDERSLLAALARASALADASPPNPDAVPLGGPAAVRATALDAETGAHAFERKARWIADAVAAARAERLQPAGLARTTSIARGVVSSAGRDVHGVVQRASFSLTATGASGSGVGERIASTVGALDPEVAIRRAVEKARRAQDPIAIEPGETDVVLEPLAASALLLFAATHGFGAREVLEESSFLCGRVGERLFPETLSIEDDASNATYPGLPFDGEGTPRARVPLIERGVVRGPVTDERYARRLGLPCTGHSPRQPSDEGPLAENLVVAPGERTLEDLVRGVERGLLVTQLHYTNVIDPRELLLTGMTRNGTFLIERGEVVAAVRNLRFTESLVRALGRLSGVGARGEVAGALFGGEVVVPALAIQGFRFTSATDF